MEHRRSVGRAAMQPVLFSADNDRTRLSKRARGRV